MARSIPKVREGFLQQHIAEDTSIDTISIGTAKWYSWLEQHHSFTFETPRMTFTARKEQRPGGWYWYAYRRSQGKLRTAYLGKSAELTLERLNAVAAAFERAGEALEGGTPRSLHVSGAKSVQGQPASIISFPTIPPIAERLREPEPAPKHNLPVQLAPLIGRTKEVALVQNLLQHEDIRLLTLTGPGGIGKTRMALQVAAELSDRFTDGILFVNLASISGPMLVVPAIAQTLEVKESSTQSLLDLLKAYLGDKQLLLLLDNFEQVISAAVQVADLLAACPQLKVMVTSRAVLHVQGEQEFAVPPLTIPNPNHLPDLAALSQYEAVISSSRARRRSAGNWVSSGSLLSIWRDWQASRPHREN